jgi:hypothetical protein
VTLLLVKLILAPSFVVGASLVARRFGPRVAGLVGGLPVVAGPILLVFALAHGRVFTAHAAAAVILGLVSLTGFVVTYAALARRTSWHWSLLTGWAVFFALTALLRLHGASAPAALAIALAGFAVALVVLPHGSTAPVATTARPRWDLPLRAASALVLVVALTGAAGALGPRLSGLLATFPIITSVLATFTHAQLGVEDTHRLLRGFVLGFFAYALFCFVVSVSIRSLGTGAAFALATGLAVLMQGTLLALDRPRLSRRAPS